MPISKKRKKEKKKSRRRDGEPPAAAPATAVSESGGRGGLLGRMRGGMQDLAGSGGRKKPESLLSKIITWALVAVLAYFVAKRFGIIK